MRILAIDDDHYVLDLLQVILSAEGHLRLESRTSPHQGLQVLKGHMCKYDCILLDIMMPEMDGITLCKKIREIPRYEDTPVIMLTAKSDKESINSAFAAGATDFVRKPFDVYEVLARIRLSKKLSAAKNENKALRLRAKLDRRKFLTQQFYEEHANHKRNQAPCCVMRFDKSNKTIPSVSRTPSDKLNRKELAEQFSRDFLELSDLNPRRRKSAAC